MPFAKARGRDRSACVCRKVSSWEVGLGTQRLVVSLGLILLASLGFGQSNSSAFPPDKLLQRITVDGLRAHMAFLADDLLEGRGTGTRGYQLAANYVRALRGNGIKTGGSERVVLPKRALSQD